MAEFVSYTVLFCTKTCSYLKHAGTFQNPLKYLYSKTSKTNFISLVIFLDFKPRGVAVGMIPGLPAFLLFKLLRFADYSNDDKMIKHLLQHIISGIKKVEKVKKHLLQPR